MNKRSIVLRKGVTPAGKPGKAQGRRILIAICKGREEEWDGEMENPLKYFAQLTDPRVERTREHLLAEIPLIAIAAVLSGASGWNDIEDYGKAKWAWLKSFLRLPGGIPSHDTFNRVFSALDPEELEKGFVAWVSSIAKLTTGEVVAIDGKALRGTRQAGKKTLVHMVSAWANTNNLVLGQRKVDAQSNEIRSE